MLHSSSTCCSSWLRPIMKKVHTVLLRDVLSAAGTRRRPTRHPQLTDTQTWGGHNTNNGTSLGRLFSIHFCIPNTRRGGPSFNIINNNNSRRTGGGRRGGKWPPKEFSLGVPVTREQYRLSGEHRLQTTIRRNEIKNREGFCFFWRFLPIPEYSDSGRHKRIVGWRGTYRFRRKIPVSDSASVRSRMASASVDERRNKKKTVQFCESSPGPLLFHSGDSDLLVLQVSAHSGSTASKEGINCRWKEQATASAILPPQR